MNLLSKTLTLVIPVLFCSCALTSTTTREFNIEVQKKRDVAITGGEMIKHVAPDGTVTYVFKNPKEIIIKQ